SQAFDVLPDPLVVMLIAALPIVEVRGSIPVGILVYEMSWPLAALLSLVGNLAVAPLLWAALSFVEKVGRRSRRIAYGLDWLYARTRRKASRRGESVKAGSVFAIVALPLPGAGTWTAVLTAYVLAMERRRALFAIVAGALVEVAVITAVVVSGAQAWQWLVSL
ncbi:MAG TPA: small multi-drug export protein, partial [Candidatus Thermoplasmatota archaeon]|nr:small multi-drug export protein [Candidatus Thermoplasmatota archaeon]